MLGKCTNPSCSASFRHMQEGILFRLEPDPDLRLPNPKKPEYYWLCQSCSAAMTLLISKEGKVIAVPLPAPVQGGTPRSDSISSRRQNGLMLSCLTSSTEKRRRRSKRSAG
jgi:hypothetical protein